MFGRRPITVEVGDVFIEPLAGKRRIFKALGIAERADASTFEMLWDITEIMSFDGLPHARLRSRENGNERVISVDALSRQDFYLKKQ